MGHQALVVASVGVGGERSWAVLWWLLSSTIVGGVVWLLWWEAKAPLLGGGWSPTPPTERCPARDSPGGGDALPYSHTTNVWASWVVGFLGVWGGGSDQATDDRGLPINRPAQGKTHGAWDMHVPVVSACEGIDRLYT